MRKEPRNVRPRWLAHKSPHFHHQVPDQSLLMQSLTRFPFLHNPSTDSLINDPVCPYGTHRTFVLRRSLYHIFHFIRQLTGNTHPSRFASRVRVACARRLSLIFSTFSVDNSVDNLWKTKIHNISTCVFGDNPEPYPQVIHLIIYINHW